MADEKEFDKKLLGKILKADPYFWEGTPVNSAEFIDHVGDVLKKHRDHVQEILDTYLDHYYEPVCGCDACKIYEKLGLTK